MTDAPPTPPRRRRAAPANDAPLHAAPRGGSMSNPFTVFVAKLLDTGWRRAFPWAALVIVCWAFVSNIVSRDLPPIDLDPYIWLAGFVTTTFMFRGAVDKGGIAGIIRAARAAG